ncbi:c-binding -like [Pelobates cultripes]|uniref:C-binding -like n=1 Tax=Pelobates cultripes TaxID=61616 RepID=A0AAD1WPV7_PELCU|nr:c-binding -like [Pelobates cultripes]
MGINLILCVCFVLYLGGYAFCETLGKDFAVVFMQNFRPDHGKPRLRLTLTAFFQDTQVNISLPKTSFCKLVSVMPGSSVTVTLPVDSELLNSCRSNKVVSVHSTQELSVVANNERPYTSSTWIVYPITEWGREYYVFTPDSGPRGTFAQIAVINGPTPNLVTATLTDMVFFDKKSFSPGEPLHLTLEPWESVQLQSSYDLSGSHLVSQETIGVFTGHSCAQKNTHCTHICMQLLPITSWGSNFVAPPIQFQNTYSVYVMASAETVVIVKNDNNTLYKEMIPGSVEEFKIPSSMSAHISSTVALMALLYSSGGIYKDLIYGGFLLNLTPEEEFCSSYGLVSLPSLKNLAFIVIPRNSASQLQYNQTKLMNLQWRDVDGTTMMYTKIPYMQHSGYSVISHPYEQFGLFSVGFAKMSAYGVPGVCLDRVQSLHSSVQSMDELPLNRTDGKTVFSPLHPTCIAWGRSHFRTFDGSYVIQSGNCTAVLLALKDHETSSQSFSVERKMKPDIALIIRTSGMTIEIPVNEPGEVTVDGVQFYLPLSFQEGPLNVTRLGPFTEASFSFGLRVLIGKGFLYLTIPSFSALTGLCVGYTGNSTNQSSLGLPTDEPCASGSWRYYEECNRQISNITNTTTSCSLLEELDVFKECSEVLDSKPFVKSCMFEVCENAFFDKCKILESYAKACAVEGVNMNGWRNLAKCDLQCPLNSYYESCSPFSTCLGSQSSECDRKQCFEDCVCQPNYKLQMGSCTPMEQCLWGGNYYPNGTELLSSNCQTMCLCNGSTGEVECQNVNGCDPGYMCGLDNDLWSCLAFIKESCSVYTSSNYVTFDGHFGSIIGYCDTKMAGLCVPTNELENFDVHLITHEGATPGSNHIKAVDIYISGRLVTLSHVYNGRVEVDGVLYDTPVLLNGGEVVIFQSGLGGVIVLSYDGLTFSFDNGQVLALIPMSYTGAVCGLCVSEPTNPELEICRSDCHKNCSTCSLMGSYDLDSCGMLVDDNGPFRDCYRKLDTESFIHRCIADLCNEDDLCKVLSSYTTACQEEGAVVHSWRTDTFCSHQCPPNSHYTVCGPSCPLACNNFQPHFCPLTCRESCSCDSGYVLGGGKCVLPEDCGCLYNGHYLQLGEAFYDDDCWQLCECLNGTVTCKEQACHRGEECVIDKGVRSCLPKMMPACWVTNNLYYHTFDGAILDANGNRNYTMSKLCQPSDLLAFEVYLQSEAVETNFTMLSTATLHVYGHSLTVSRNTEGIQVDGETQYFPIVVEFGKIVASKHGPAIHITSDFGLFIFGPSWVSLQISVRYMGNVCGLCGNANGNAGDDFDAVNATEFLLQWISEEMCAYPTNMSGCVFNETSKFEDKNYCGQLLMKEGYFRHCHAVIPPEPYFKTCILHMTLESGHEEALIQNLQRYRDVCLSARTIVHPWGTGSQVEDQIELTKYPMKEKSSLIERTSGYNPQKRQHCFIFQNNYIPFGGLTFKEFAGSSNVSLVQFCPEESNITHEYFAVHYMYSDTESRGQLWFRVYGVDIVLDNQEPFNVWVNGMFIDPPAVILPGKVWLNQNGLLLTLETDIGLSILYDGQLILILFPENFHGSICGLCAQTNTSEFSTPITPTSANSWRCNGSASSDPSLCLLLLDERGPYGACHDVFSPFAFYDLCLAQQCRYDGDNLSVCQTLHDYAMICQSQGVSVQPWRKNDFCPFLCPLRSVYTPCVRPCGDRCIGDGCLAHCMEGCSCQEGLVWDGLDCVDAIFCLQSTKEELVIYESTERNQHLVCQQNETSQACLQCIVNSTEITSFAAMDPGEDDEDSGRSNGLSDPTDNESGSGSEETSSDRFLKDSSVMNNSAIKYVEGIFLTSLVTLSFCIFNVLGP